MPLNALMDDNYLKQRMANFSFDKATSSSDIKRKRNVQRKYGNDYSIVDQFGNAIAATTTLNAVMVRITVMTWAFIE
jgi:gamma-glutamyltranspeptidase/glutathione hydrolase